MSNNASNNNSFAASFTGQLEKDFTKYISALVDWAEFASQMETANGSSKVTARIEYELQNRCNGIWAALYGNTTDVSFIPDRNTELDQRTRFCARLNTAYWETRRNEYRAANPHVDKAKPEYSSVEAANDMEWLNIIVSMKEAILNYNRLVAEFHMVSNMYELVTGNAFEYVPYKVQPKTNASKANAKLASALLEAA
jgi:hypothetical protein